MNLEEQKRIEEAKETTQYILKESKRLEHVQALDIVKDVREKIFNIEEKEIK
jgi:hypothetical protein